MLYLIHTYNPHWKQQDFQEWHWPKRRIFYKLLHILKGPLSIGIGGLRRTGKTTLLKQLMGFQKYSDELLKMMFFLDYYL